MTAAAFRVVAASARGVVLTRTARSRREADEILGAVMAAHPDCEITLYVGDVVALSVCAKMEPST